MSAKKRDTSPPIEKIVKKLWARRSELKTRKDFQRAVEELIEQHGLIDRLTPGVVTYRHNDPHCPGNLRVQLASKGVVLLHVYFREAPSAKASIEIPTDNYTEGMEKNMPPQVLLALVNILLQRAAASARKSESKPKPKLVLPG